MVKDRRAGDRWWAAAQGDRVPSAAGGHRDVRRWTVEDCRRHDGGRGSAGSGRGAADRETYVEPDREPYEAERRESTLVQSFATHLRRQDHEVCRLQIVPKGEYKPLFTDLYDVTADLLVEAKGSVTRETIRMAIGQLADYSRFAPSARKAILLPSRPRPDLEDLTRGQSIEIIWPNGNSFASTNPGLI